MKVERSVLSTDHAEGLLGAVDSLLLLLLLGYVLDVWVATEGGRCSDGEGDEGEVEGEGGGRGMWTGESNIF